jgi:hypothetical protein
MKLWPFFAFGIGAGLALREKAHAGDLAHAPTQPRARPHVSPPSSFPGPSTGGTTPADVRVLAATLGAFRGEILNELVHHYQGSPPADTDAIFRARVQDVHLPIVEHPGHAEAHAFAIEWLGRLNVALASAGEAIVLTRPEVTEADNPNVFRGHPPGRDMANPLLTIETALEIADRLRATIDRLSPIAGVS